jgi:hypothetical protein
LDYLQTSQPIVQFNYTTLQFKLISPIKLILPSQKEQSVCIQEKQELSFEQIEQLTNGFAGYFLLSIRLIQLVH